MPQQIPKTLLLLDSGNRRSRLAEVIFNSVASKMGLAWRASARGLAPEGGANTPIAASAWKALVAMGIRDIGAVSQSPAPVSAEDFESATRIVALERKEQLPSLQEHFQAWIEKIEFWNIDDVADVLPRIEREVVGLVARIVGGGERQEHESSAVPSSEQQPVKEPAKKQITLKVGRETAGRRGKGVTTVFDMPLGENAVLELAAKLKQRCGTGGTVKDGRIEIQGDQRERIIAELEKLGYKTKRVGG